MFSIAKRIMNGMIMVWVALLFVFRYILGYYILWKIFDIGLAYIAKYIRSQLSVLPGARFLFKIEIYALTIFLIVTLLVFIEIAIMKYIMARLNHDVSPTKGFDSFYCAFRQIIPIIILSIIVSTVAIATPWIYVLFVPIGFAILFVPVLIAEEKTSWAQMVPESLRILQIYWPECIGFIIVSVVIPKGILALINPAELSLMPFPPLIGFPVFKTILVQAAHHKNVGEEFAPYLKNTHA